MRFGVVVWLALCSVGSARAIDYDKIARPLVKEPKYKSKKPCYALLLFGPEAKLAVWAVLDGETLYIDRNGNGDLTDDGERFATEADCKGVEIADPDGKTRYVIDLVQTDNTIYTPSARRDRAAKGVPPEMMVNVTVKGTVEYKQYCDLQQLRDDPKKAMLAHFHGPLTAGVSTINWKVPERTVLRAGDRPTELRVVIGTMSEKHGCWVVVRTCAGEECAFPDGVRPVAEVVFPSADPKAQAIKKRYTLDKFC
jgi:hypothetical protein